MANQANTSMADSPEQKIKDCHSAMVIRLGKHFNPKLQDNWEELLLWLSKFLDPVDLQRKDNSFIQICYKLMAQGIIDYGSYDELYEVIKKIDAGPAKIIQETSEEIKDIKSKGLPEATPPKTGVGDQTKEFSPKIADMIERTKAMIEEDKKRTFIDTKGFQDAKEKLHKSQVVVIKGNTGDGKTTTAIRLILGLIEEQHGRQPLKLHNIKDLESLPTKSKLITFIDDIFGEKVVHEKDVGKWNKRIKSVLPTPCGDKPTEANFLLITIRNEVFNSLSSHSLENVFIDSNIIDLSSDDYKIKGEKLKLLELYKPIKDEFSWEEDEKEEIVKYASGIGFPQCCVFFRDSPDLQKKRVDFFKKPVYFLSKALEKLKECNAILFLFLNNGKIEAKDLDPNGEKVDKTLLGEAFDIDLKGVGDNRSEWKDKRKIQFVRESLDTLSGFLVVKKKNRSGDGFVYKFAHDSIYATVETLYRQITPTGFIEYCPSKSRSLFTISESSPDRILLTPDNYVYMFKCIHRVEWKTSRYDDYESIGSLDVWTDRPFIERFVRWLNVDQNIDDVDVLNKACLFGVKPCALYLLSQGVKPDKGTDWLSLITKGGSDDVDLLEKVVVYMSDEMKLDLLNKVCTCGLFQCTVYLLSQGVKSDKDTPLLSLIWNEIDDGHGDWMEIYGVGKDVLEKVLVYLSDENKHDLLNKACFFGFVQCTLYLLSQGVKPDKDTRLLSLIWTKVEYFDGWDGMDHYVVDMYVLKKVIIYMNDEMKLDLLNKVCSQGYVEIALYLLSHGAKPDKDTDLWLLVKTGWESDDEHMYRESDDEHIGILKKVFIYMNDEMKLDLLDKVRSDGLDECVLYLLSQGVKPHKDTDWWSLVTGYLGCDVDIGILENVVVCMDDEMKLVLLNKACCYGSDECVKYLLSEDVECEENTPFCVVKTGNINMLRNILSVINDEIKLVLLNVTCSLEREEMVTMLCNTYPELVHDTSGRGQSPLLLAAETGNCGIFHTVERVILKSLYRVEDERHQCESVDGRVVHRNCVCSQYMSQCVDQSGDTILNMICKRGHTKLCVYMCQSYPELTTVVDHNGMTALHASCVGGHGEICKYLCRSYPELTTVVDHSGRHFLHHMAKSISDVSMFTECETLVKQYLESTGHRYDVTTILDNKGRTVLHCSCESGRTEICKYLCQSYPALTTAVDEDEKNVLHVSCEREHTEICKYLCQLCPELTTAVDKDGWHCLHYIARNTFDVDMFTEFEVYVKQYLESLGLKYDITTILNSKGQSVFDVIRQYRSIFNPSYKHLVQLFGK